MHRSAPRPRGIVLGLCALAFVPLLLVAQSCGDRRSKLVGPSIAGLQARIDGATVRLSWSQDPGSTHSTLSRTRILRRLNIPPESADDPLATVVFDGEGAVAGDPVIALEPSTVAAPRTYHYAAYACAPGGCLSTPSRASITPTLAECLRGGGYAIWWRHASANVCSDRTDLGTAATTSVPGWWKSCDPACPPAGMATARQLNAAGVAEATAIGQEFDRLGIPVGRVISSEYCRCFHTAELMDFGPAIELDSTITFFVYDENDRCTNSLNRIAEPPVAGTNTALIGHGGFNTPCPDIGPLAWGEAAVFKVFFRGEALFVERVLWNQWATFEASARAARR